MQLSVARVCLDCEEVHDAQACPVCASETFAYLTRWVPVQDRRTRPRPAPKIIVPTRTQRIIFGGGVLSLLTYWLVRSTSKLKEKAERSAGELR